MNNRTGLGRNLSIAINEAVKRIMDDHAESVGLPPVAGWNLRSDGVPVGSVSTGITPPDTARIVGRWADYCGATASVVATPEGRWVKQAALEIDGVPVLVKGFVSRAIAEWETNR